MDVPISFLGMVSMNAGIDSYAESLVGQVGVCVNSAQNEFALHQAIEGYLGRACGSLQIPWVSFSVNVALSSGKSARPRFADSVHGAVVIEYKAPSSFGGRVGRVLDGAREQLEEYVEILTVQEGRPLEDYELVAWDGSHISFGRFVGGQYDWDDLVPFDASQAVRLFQSLRNGGRPLVHPILLSQLVGPESECGKELMPSLFGFLVAATSEEAPTTKTKLLFTEWNRLFGQVVGVQSDRLRSLVSRQMRAHEVRYEEHVAQYIFAMSTQMALVAKLVAALSLPDATTDVGDGAVDLKERLSSLEDGSLFRDAGVLNMLSGDFFGWYLDAGAWSVVEPGIRRLIIVLSQVDFDVASKSSDSVRDLFKGMYEQFMPQAMRHALGEYYTPDWLAAYVLDQLGWEPSFDLLDPTCGTGTFLLEAVKRRFQQIPSCNADEMDPGELLAGIYGMDLNPLAVLAARSSLVVFLSSCLSSLHPVTLPIWLADAVNSAQPKGTCFEHELLTEQGVMRFRVPVSVVTRTDFGEIFETVRQGIDVGMDASAICVHIRNAFELVDLPMEEGDALDESIRLLVSLHEQDWDGIWCAILAERFMAGSIPKVSCIAGNPPWVKWSNLPPEYAELIRERCRANGVFSDDVWTGGIESDISTVITFEVLSKWLEPNGKLAFLMTGTVFANESSLGFRRLRYGGGGEAAFLSVEDFDRVKPFEGVSNHPVLMLLQNGLATRYPVPYRSWDYRDGGRQSGRVFKSTAEFLAAAESSDRLAVPIYGTDAGPWLKGTDAQHELWKRMFNRRGEPAYLARKGVCTDRNGVFFVEVKKDLGQGKCRVRNNPDLGRYRGLVRVGYADLESDHVFPLLRGRGVSAFEAVLDPEYCILVPQRRMHGDADLVQTAPGVVRYLTRFKNHLTNRGSYRRYQAGQPFWSLWNVGAYTFSPYKVVWPEMSGGNFRAAYVSEESHPILGRKMVVPDHKLYFVPVDTEMEAAYLTGLLNSPSVAEAIAAYSPGLSLGTNVVEHLAIPRYNPCDLDHFMLAVRSRNITRRGGGMVGDEGKSLDRLSRWIVMQSAR